MKYAQIRICEWTAVLPQITDSTGNLKMAQGSTYVEFEDDEKLSEIESTPVGNSFFVPMEDEEGKTKNVPHTTYVFRATLVKAVPEEQVLKAVDGEDRLDAQTPKSSLIVPGKPNRAARRAAGKSTGGYVPNGN